MNNNINVLDINFSYLTKCLTCQVFLDQQNHSTLTINFFYIEEKSQESEEKKYLSGDSQRFVLTNLTRRYSNLPL